MDGSTFDTLTRSLHRGHSRRGLAGLLSGLALGGPLALLGQTEADAKRKKKKKKKKRPTSTTQTPLVPGPTCTPNCASKQCGPDGCGSVCGTCPLTSQSCTAAGQCACLSNQRTCPTGACVPTGGCCSGNDCLNMDGDPGECEAGTCFYKPRCSQAGVRCTETAIGCCGGCSTATGQSLCTNSSAGQSCYTTADCNSGLACVRFKCQAST